MSRWTDLYPAWWRERYADEMAGLLADRPPTIRDRLDLILGAVDAHLYPPPTPTARSGRGRTMMAGALALIGAAVWAEAVILSLSDGWDVGMVYQVAAAFLIAGTLCAGPQVSTILRWGFVWLGALLLSGLASSAGAYRLTYVTTTVGLLIAASVPLGVSAERAGAHGIVRIVMVAWGAVVPVMMFAAGQVTALDDSVDTAVWLAASALWITSWVLVGLMSLRSREVVVSDAAAERS